MRHLDGVLVPCIVLKPKNIGRYCIECAGGLAAEYTQLRNFLVFLKIRRRHADVSMAEECHGNKQQYHKCESDNYSVLGCHAGIHREVEDAFACGADT